MLEIRNIHKSFTVPDGKHRVIRDLSFHFRAGAFHIVLGQSGCGKSTLLRMLGGFERPDEGEVILKGKTVRKPSRDMMMVFQSFDQLFPWFTLKKNLIYGLTKTGICVPDNDYAGYVTDYLVMAGLGDFMDCYPHQLSGGMKQRGALARALCLRPEVLLMDEPFSSLDGMTKRGLYDSVQRMTGDCEATIIMVTHDIEEALILGSVVMVLSKESGRFSAVYEAGPEGFNADVRSRLETHLR